MHDGAATRSSGGSAASAVRDRTYRLDRWRALGGGVIETASSTFLLLIAVRHFEAGATAKGLIGAGSGAGMVLTPLVVTVARRVGLPCSRFAARILAVGSLGFLLAAAVPDLVVYVAGTVGALLCGYAVVPLLTQVYQDSYAPQERGGLFARAVMVRIVTAGLFSQAAGWALAADFARYRALLVLFALAMLFSSACLARMPSRPLAAVLSQHPFQAMRYLVEDAVFRRTLISWMFMGFANLMMLPLRVEYLASPRFGLVLSTSAIAFLTGLLPNLARLAMSPVWGHLFDRVNFFLLRILVNASFAIGILAFFAGESTAGLVVGGLAYGVAGAGGDVAWSLWVTKVAPPERVADYMSVHTFFTGVRSLVAPLVGFQLARSVSLGTMGLLAAGLILVATVLLLPEVRWRPRRVQSPILEEFTE